MALNVEICVTSVQEAMVAASCGADSVELCTWLGCGGVTPSSGLVDAVRSAVHIPVRVLVRPTPGGFVYSAPEAHALLVDAEILGGGAIGLVTGALHGEGDVDLELMRAVKRVAPESEITFHRAIDRAADPLRVVERCLELGFERILSSGARTFAIEGTNILKQLIGRAEGKLVICAGGGIDAGNVVELVERTGVTEVHFSAQGPGDSAGAAVALSPRSAGMNFDVVPDRAKIEGVMNALVKAGLR